MEFSFLIGAGFSIPEGYPKTDEINSRLRKIDKNDIEINSEGVANFLSKNQKPSDIFGETERLFIQEFLKFYNKEILKGTESFHYEKFFDFYTDLIRVKSTKKTVQRFNTFINGFNREQRYTLLGKNLKYFDKHFIQLLASYFNKKKQELGFSLLTKPYAGDYASFLYFLDFLDNKYKKIHINTLNHDLLMESLSFSEAMKGNFSDGFNEIGSPFYRENNWGESIRLKLFVNKFDKKFCLYKLHGSLDQYYIDNYNRMVRVKKGTALGKTKIELKGEEDYKYIDKLFTPDILSGIKEKKRNYSMKCYYEPVFKHFEENLKKSDNLIVIGYGLRDDGINDYIKKHFLSNKNSKMLVIDPIKAKSPLYNYRNVIYYGENLGIQDIDIKRITKILDLN
jgi:hypothetical protein